MTVSCPRCGNTIDQDFGVAACTNCQAVLFIDMDGNAQITEGELNIPPFEALPPDAPTRITQSQDFQAWTPESSQAEPAPESVALPDLGLAEDEPTQLLPLEKAASIPQEQLESLAEPEPSGTGVYESQEQVLGAISYSVKIQYIDTKEIRLQMIEALDDPKFQWDPREVLRTVKEGTLELKNLNPVKASVIVQRVRELPVKVSWTQNVYS